jgi:hypothetical protein
MRGGGTLQPSPPIDSALANNDPRQLRSAASAAYRPIPQPAAHSPGADPMAALLRSLSGSLARAWKGQRLMYGAKA